MNKFYKLFIVACFSVWAFSVSAQYVTIPDAKFAAYLDTIIPSAMSGNQMDTTSIAVTTLKGVYVENRGIKNLSGVQYFKTLVTLDCASASPSLDSNKLTSLPPLPNSLDTLICGNTKLDSLPVLPNALTYLNCYINRITNLPALPAGLIHLDCFLNQMSSLPVLPGSLLSLDCGGNLFTSLPPLPAGLMHLGCTNSQITGLPTLPATLIFLDCQNSNLVSLPTLPAGLIEIMLYNNKLTSLPALPDSLMYFDCDLNQLTNLPALPPYLTFFECSNNQLTSLPALPNSLTQFQCDNNQITSLPTLPDSLVLLDCYNNNISCFPVFPNSLRIAPNLKIFGNPFSCLPNYVGAMDSTTLAYPLCSPINPSGCLSSYGIAGFTYKDMDANCSRNTGDMNLVNIPVQIDSGGILLSQTYSAINGVYDFSDSAGKYTVLIDTAGMPFMVQCAHPGYDSTLVLTSIDTNVNFSLTCKGGFDVGVQSVLAQGLVFPGMQHSLDVIAGDISQWYNLNCASGMSGTVQISVSGPVTYVGPAAGALTPSVAGNVFTYTIADFGAINNTTAFNLLLNTDTTAKASDSICVSVSVTPAVDNNSSNNNYHYCYSVVDSHDPNVKETYPVNVAPGYNGWFNYTIHFQNTGNASAHNILLSDTLDSKLDLKTFQLINYSNKNVVTVNKNVLTVQFHNINLPDSTGNQTGSVGFIQYRIKPKTALPSGTVIKNTAYIYFDFNSPVITDTTYNVFENILTSIDKASISSSCKVFPNPNNGQFTIALQNLQSKCHVLIYNEIGQEAYSTELSLGNTQVHLTGKSTGIYFYRIITEAGKLVSSGKMVVE